jgi:DNA-binding MarR family transcriptional regulator
MSKDSPHRRELIRELTLAVRMHQNAVEVMDDAAADHLGINRTDTRCLDIIERLGTLTAGELARESGLTTGAITTALDRLEAKGYVRRVRDDRDRRKIMVEITEEARQRAWEAYGPLAERGGVELTHYTNEQLELLRDFLQAGRELLIDHAARVRAMARDRR